MLNIQLNGEAKTFSALVGADDCKRGSSRTSVEFFVIGDGRLLWSSGVMRTQEEAMAFQVGVAGVKQLLLKVGDANDGNNDDFAIHPFKVMGGFLRDQPRDIVFSLCQYGNNDVWKWGVSVNANCWRMTGDVNDSWRSIKQIGFYQDKAAPFAKPGNWTDPDMLIFGWVGWGRPHPTSLTPDEQYTHISLWCMLAAPLLIGSDMDKMDDFILSLLTNDEVLAVDQDELGKQATCVMTLSEINGKVADVRVYEKELADGGRAIGFFNLGTEPVKLEFKDFAQLNVSGKQTIRDLWRQQNLATINTAQDSLPLSIPGHGVLLYKFTPAS